MKNVALIILSFSLILAFVSCDKNDDPTPEAATGTLAFQFKAQYGDESLVLYEPYTHPNGSQLIFSDLSFYISDLSLIREDGKALRLKEIDRIRLNDGHADAAAAAEGTAYLIDDIPAGNYMGVHIGIGVKDSLNAMRPEDFPFDHPLSQSGQYWTGWQSYIFVRTEGKADTLNSGVFDLDLALHTGGDTTYRVKEFIRPIEISMGNRSEFPIVIDYRDFLVPADGDPYDFIATPQIHTLNHVEEAIELADNFQKALR